MFIEFSVGNFRSFRDIETLHMQAAKIRSRYDSVDQQNVIAVSDKLELLKSKAVYGANASGKSNLIRALVSMFHIIRDSVKDETVLKERIESFALCEDNRDQPSFFQIVFILDGVRYRYGFEATEHEIHSEWLFGTPDKQEVYFFKREGMEVQVNKKRFKEGARLIEMDTKDGFPLYRENSLFLTIAATFNGPLAKKILEYFEKRVTVISGLNDPRMTSLAMKAMAMSEEDFQTKILQVMKEADFGIEDLEVVEISPENMPEEMREEIAEMLSEGKKIGFVQVFKKMYDAQGKYKGTKAMILQAHESEGTKKMFALSPFLFDAMEKGSALFIDEFDARLHPRISRKIVELFNSPDTNPNNAQLIFVTHDTNLMDAKLLRRDQICFVEKDKFGASHLYTLVEYKGIRNDASFEKDYLKGKYGAVPNLLRIEEPFEQYLKHAEADQENG